jgi:hypothetical protein
MGGGANKGREASGAGGISRLFGGGGTTTGSCRRTDGTGRAFKRISTLFRAGVRLGP